MNGSSHFVWVAVLIAGSLSGGGSPSVEPERANRDRIARAGASAPNWSPQAPAHSRPSPNLNTPRWFVDAPEGQWIEIAAGASRGDLSAAQRGDRIFDVAPNPSPPGAEGVSAVTNDWTGGTALQGRGEYILPAQGGHNGYYGNEIYALALRDETPHWQRIWGPTPNDQISTSEHRMNAPYTAYKDGSPRPWHGWFRVQASERDERIWLLGTGANPSGTWTTETYSIARADLDRGWTYHGRLWTDLGGMSDFFYQSGPSAYDRTSHQLFVAAEQSNIEPFLVRVDVEAAVRAGPRPESGPLVTGLTGHLGYHAADFPGAWSAVAYDLSPRVWILGETRKGRIVVLDLDFPNSGFTPIEPRGPAPPAYGAAMGAVYHAQSRALIVGGLPRASTSDRRLWKLSIPNDPILGKYTWSVIDPVAGTTPSSNDQYRGTYGKLQCIENMGNGQSAIVYVTNVKGPTYVFKVPVRGL